MPPCLNRWHSASARRAGDLHVTHRLETPGAPPGAPLSPTGVDDAATSGTKAPVNEYEIAGCQADADAVVRYYLPWQPK